VDEHERARSLSRVREVECVEARLKSAARLTGCKRSQVSECVCNTPYAEAWQAERTVDDVGNTTALGHNRSVTGVMMTSDGVSECACQKQVT
jgi:hypothetical protein